MKKSIKVLCLFVVMTQFSCAQKAESTFKAELIVDGLQIPWGMVFLPDGSMLISEKSGEIIHFKNGQKSTIQNGPEVYNRGQGGLLDMELHPDYENTGWICGSGTIMKTTNGGLNWTKDANILHWAKGVYGL